MAARAADDFEIINHRFAELRKEAIDRLNVCCDCPDKIQNDGTTVKTHASGCRFCEADWMCGFAASPEPPLIEILRLAERQTVKMFALSAKLLRDTRGIQHSPVDDWAALRVEAGMGRR